VAKGHLLTLTHRPTEMAVQVFDDQGRLLCRVERVLERNPSDADPFVLQADEALSSTITLMESALRRASVAAEDLAGIGFCVSCHAMVLWNQVSGAPLLTIDTPSHWSHLGPCDAAAYLRVAVAAAMREPGAPGRAEDLRVGGMDSWLLSSLTQGESSYIGQGHDFSLYAFAADGQINSDFVALCQLSACSLPALMAAQGMPRLSAIYLDGARPRVCALTYVQTASLIGTGLESPGRGAFVTYDREGAVALSVGERKTSLTDLDGVRLLGYRPLPSMAAPGVLALMGRFTTPQLIASWLDVQVVMSPQVAAVAVELGQTGPLVLPADPWLPGQAAVFGIVPGTTPEILYAAALRSMAFSVREILEQAEAITGNGVDILYTDVVGYGIPSLFSFQAGLCRCPVLASTGDSSALGAAAVTGLAAGLWSRQTAAAMLEEQYSMRRYDVPQIDESVHEQYFQWKEIKAQLAQLNLVPGVGTGIPV